ncbi:MAG: hemolysin family protein [Anaerolineaceae bacterium]
MDNPLWFALVVLVLLDMYFAAVRTALVNAHIPRLVNLEDPTPQQIEATLKVLERPRLRASFRLTLGLTHFLIAGLTWWTLDELSGRTITLIGSLGIFVAAVLILLALEFLAERLPLRSPERWSVRLHGTAKAMDVVMTPLSWLMIALQGSADLAQRNDHTVTEDELKTWVETEQPGGSLEKDERRMIYSIFQFGDTLCREIMVPRIDVLALDVNTSIQDAMSELVRSGHSRVPVYEDSIDNVIGLLYAKDLLKMTRAQEQALDLRKLLRPAYFVPESKKVDELLAEMQANGVHLVVVVDEYGGMAGVVTLEDIVEEIVGEIRDEYDQGEELAAQEISADEYLFKAQVSLDDVNELLNTNLTADLSDSLGGFIFSQLGRVPLQGDVLPVGEWSFTVEEIHGQRIGMIRARRLTTEKEDDNGSRPATKAH